MTEHSYTVDDIRAEAARQHATLAEDPDFMGVGEMMDGRYVHYEVDEALGCFMPAPGTPRWDELSEGDFEAAQREIHDLINGAADLSDWAVNLGADGLEPVEHSLSLGADDRPIARVHFAFEPGMPEAMRQSLVMGIATEIAKRLPADEAT